MILSGPFFVIINLIYSITVGISCGFFFCFLARRSFSSDIILEFIEKIETTKPISFAFAFFFVLLISCVTNIFYKKVGFLAFPKIIVDLSVLINGLIFYLSFDWILRVYLLKSKKGEKE